MAMWRLPTAQLGHKTQTSTHPQRFMDEVLEGIPHVFVYLDDMLVASRNQVEHQEDLRRVLQCLEEHGLVLNKEKCTFSASHVDYLGHVVDATSVKPLQACVAAISDFPPPSTKGELQRFLGMVNYYHRFISRAASILKPLTDTTRGPGGRNTPVEWTQQLNSAFKQARLCCQARQPWHTHLKTYSSAWGWMPVTITWVEYFSSV